MKKAPGEVVGFTFQEIPLEEALNVVLAGDGSYGDLKQMLLEKLPTLAPDKAFAFGLPDGKEVPEDQRRGICVAINSTLKKARMPWKITYSGTKKLFICVPRVLKIAASAKLGKPPHPNKYTVDKSNDAKILALRAQGLMVGEIAEQVDAPLGRIKYLCYHIFPKQQPPPESNGNGHSGPISAPQFVEMARMVFNYKGGFKDGEARAIRKAICIVGVNKLKIHPGDLAPLLGLTKDGVYYNANLSKSTSSQEVRTLQKAVKQEA